MSGSNLTSLIDRGRTRFRTASAFVVETLRTAILDGALSEGAPLRQDELAAAFQVSRMPIREALRQLEAEGLVDFVPHKGAVVAILAPEEIAEIYEMRLMAETFALGLSLPHLSREHLARAAGLLDELDAEADPHQWSVLNRQFHMTLYSGVERKRLHVLITSLNDAVDRYLRVLLTALDYQDRSQAEHRAILAACRDGDSERAVERLAAHLRGGREQMLDFLSRRAASPLGRTALNRARPAG